MRKTTMTLAAVLVCAALTPLHAQKARRPSPTLVQPGSTPAASAPSADTTRGKGRRPAPTLVTRPGADSARPANPPASAPASAVAPQSARAVPAAPPAFTAGLSMSAYDGSSDDDRNRWLRTFVTQLDSATALLVGVFRNTSGQPLAGATAPTSLSARERERWSRCRDLHFDLRSYAAVMHDMVEELPEQAQRAGVALDSSLAALQATAECDNITSMITAPARWSPWESNYASSARNFYRDWYAQVRDVADRNRAFVMALNSSLPATSRIAVPPALPRTPPYAGAGPR